jgi:hypothetical protein
MVRYIELKTGYTDNGPAWIARVAVSRSRRTVYFGRKALKRGNVGAGNHYDLETGEAYWVSGVKKTGLDRHWAGSGRVFIEASAVAEYLTEVGLLELDASRFEVVADLPTPDPQAFRELENATPEESGGRRTRA